MFDMLLRLSLEQLLDPASGPTPQLNGTRLRYLAWRLRHGAALSPDELAYLLACATAYGFEEAAHELRLHGGGHQEDAFAAPGSPLPVPPGRRTL